MNKNNQIEPINKILLTRMIYGYVYCFSNESMPGIYKLGMTERVPEMRLNEANASDTWRPPTPYKIEMAKKVTNPKEKELTMHKLLSCVSERIHPKREFFRVSLESVQLIFDLMDGINWVDKYAYKDSDEDEDLVNSDSDKEYQPKKRQRKNDCYDINYWA